MEVCRQPCFAMFRFVLDIIGNCSNSEASASQLPQNLGEMFLRYYVDSDVINRLKYPITHRCAIRPEGVNEIYFMKYHLTCYTVIWYIT